MYLVSYQEAFPLPAFRTCRLNGVPSRILGVSMRKLAVIIVASSCVQVSWGQVIEGDYIKLDALVF